LKRVAIAEFDAVASAHSLVLRAKPKNVLPEFLPFFLLSEKFWQRAIEISVGSLSPTINWRVLAKQEFLLPPKAQQAEIAELLWAMDEVIKKEITLSNSTSVVFDSIVERKCLKADGALVPLSSVIDKLEAGVSVNSEEGKVSNRELGILKTSAVSEGLFNPNEAKKVIKSEVGRLKTKVKQGAIIISRMNTVDLVGANAYVNSDFDNLYLPDRLWQTSISREDINTKYLWFILSSGEYRKKISNLCTGTSNSMKNISKKSLLTIKVKIPTKDYQDNVATKLERVEIVTTELESRIDQSKSLQKSLINQVF
jgi:restriction endonuclease S subunit